MAEKAPKNRHLGPDYGKIFTDIIAFKFPERSEEFKARLNRDLSVFEVVSINNKLFGEKKSQQITLEHRYRAYDKQTILRILQFKRDQKLNNSQLARHYSISRNTIKRWNDIFGHLM